MRSGASLTSPSAVSPAGNGEPPLGIDIVPPKRQTIIEKRSSPHRNRGRTVAVFFDDDAFYAEPFDDAGYADAYAELGKTVTAKGGTFFIVRHMHTYRGGNSFSRGWLWTGYGFREIHGEITADVIYNKGVTFKPTPDAHVITSIAFDALCGDKTKTFELFQSLFPATVTVTNREQLETAVADMPGDKVVVKPVDGFGGRDVIIGSKRNVLAAHHAFPVIVQRFIDTSYGIPCVVESTHDFRIIVADGEVIFTYAKIPPAGTLVANIGLGGKVHVVPPELRPKDAMALVQKIDPVLAPYGRRLYSIDCGRDANGEWLLIELNAHPGLTTIEECGPYADAYFSDMADFLLRESSDAISLASASGTVSMVA